MSSALRWAAMRAILMFHNCEGQSHKTVSTDHNFWRERAEADSNRGPSAYQPNALLLGQTGSPTKQPIEIFLAHIVFKSAFTHKVKALKERKKAFSLSWLNFPSIYNLNLSSLPINNDRLKNTNLTRNVLPFKKLKTTRNSNDQQLQSLRSPALSCFKHPRCFPSSSLFAHGGTKQRSSFPTSLRSGPEEVLSFVVNL